MHAGLQLIGMAYSLSLLLATVYLIRKGRLREEYGILWLGASLIVLLIATTSQVAGGLSGGTALVPFSSVLLLLALLFTITILLSQSVLLSRLANHARDLAQSLAILDWQVRELRADPPDDEPLAAADPPAAPPMTTLHPAPNGAKPASAATRRHRVLVIGLDGATFDLIRPWAAEGHLPALNRLMQEGAHGTLRSTVPPMTAPAWSSFATGCNPARHRLYDWIAREPDSYKFTPVTALDGKAPTVYTLLSQQGRRVCVVNVPMTFPPVPVNGAMISGLPAPSTRVPITYPKALWEEIQQQVGEYILYPDPGQAYSDSGADAFLERLYRCTDGRIRTFDWLRAREDAEFAMVVFSGTDTISHAMWKHMDTAHPLHDPRRHARYGHAIRDFYRRVDQYLGQVMAELDENTTLIVMSDHGFGPFHKFIHVNNWLMNQGLMQVRPGARAGLKRALFRLGFAPMNVYNLLMRLGLGALKREVVRGQGQGLLKTLFLSFEDVDWSRTVAYSLGNVGQIRLNVIGREPQGCVARGAEYERVRDDIMARLRELRDPATGEAVVEAVYRREELYEGDFLDDAPDIVFMPRRLEYFGFGEYEFGSHRVIEAMERGISGTHRMNGIFLAYGAAIRAGAMPNDASLVDLAPTILHLMGEAVPDHMDGRVLREVLAEPWAAAPVRASSQRWDGAPNGHEALSDEDAALLSERLRSLGYVA